MWIDTHCHLDAAEFAGQEDLIAQQSAQLGVSCIVIPAVERANFAAVAALAQRQPNCRYALGIHPMYVERADESDLQALRDMLPAALTDPRLVAIGEIGLDYFVPTLREGSLRIKQEYFYAEQLKIARDFGLPVLLHVRRAQDDILKYLRRIAVPGGIAHAFNGSAQQAQTFIGLELQAGLRRRDDVYPRAANPPSGSGVAAGGDRAGNRCARHRACLASPAAQQSATIAAHR